jgi:hypothetical protein
VDSVFFDGGRTMHFSGLVDKHYFADGTSAIAFAAMR